MNNEENSCPPGMTVCKFCGTIYDRKDSRCPECGTKKSHDLQKGSRFIFFFMTIVLIFFLGDVICNHNLSWANLGFVLIVLFVVFRSL